MKDWAEWVILILFIGAVWVFDDPRRAGSTLSEFVTEFQEGVADGRQ